LQAFSVATFMNYAEIANKGVQTQPVYVPGKPIEAVAREYGLDQAAIAKLASNENPLGPSPKAMEAMRQAIEQVQLYPDGACHALREKIAAVRGLKSESIIVGNGSNEIIELLGTLFLTPRSGSCYGGAGLHCIQTRFPTFWGKASRSAHARFSS
jgi:histidinol-phosphate aminotransferase